MSAFISSAMQLLALLAGWNFSFDFLFHPEKSLLGVMFCLERYLLVICQNNSKENPHFLSFHLLFSFIQSRVCWEWWRHLAATRPSQLPNYFQWKLALFRLWKKLCCLWKNFFVFEKLFRLLEKTNLSQSAKLLSIKISTFASLKKTFCPRQKVLSSPAKPLSIKTKRFLSF